MGLPTQTDSRTSAASSSSASMSKPPPGTHSSRISIINIKSSNTGGKNGGQPKEPVIEVKVSSPLYNKHRPTSLDDLMGDAGVPAPKPQDQVPVGVTNNINIIINNNGNDPDERNSFTQVHTRTHFQNPTSSSKRPEGGNSNTNKDLGKNNKSNNNHTNKTNDGRSGGWANNNNNTRNFGNGVPEPHRFGRSHLLAGSNGLRRPTHSGICRRESHSAERKDLFSPQDSLKTPSILKDILKQQNLNPMVPRHPRTRKRDLYRHPRSKSLCCRIPSQRIPTIPEENDNDLLPIQKVVTHMKTIETLPSYPKIEYLDYPFEENEFGLADNETNKTATNLNGRENQSCALYEYKHNLFNARENGKRYPAEETKKMGHGGVEAVEGEGLTKGNRMLIGLTEDIDDDIKRFIDDEYDEDREEELSDLEFRILEKKLKEEEEEEMERNLKKEEYHITQKKMEDAEVTVIGDSALVGVFDDHNNNINQYSSSLSIASTSSGVSSSSCASSASSSSSSSSSGTDKTSKVSCPSPQSPTPPPSVSPKCKKSDSPDSSLLVSSASSSSSPSSSTSSSPVSVRSRSSSAPPPAASLERGDPAVEDTLVSPPSPSPSSKPSSSSISSAEVCEELRQTPTDPTISSTTSPSSTSTSRSLFSPSSTDGNFKRSYTLPSFVRSFTPPSFKSFQTPRLPILSPLGIVTSHRSPVGEWVPSSSRTTSSSTSTSPSTSSSAKPQPLTTTRQTQPSGGGTLTSSSCNSSPPSASSPSTSSSSVPAQATLPTTTTTSTSSTESAPPSSSPPPPSTKTKLLKEEGEHLRKKKAWMRELFFKMPYEEYYREAISKHKRSNSCPRLKFRDQKKGELEKRRENGELEQEEVGNRNSGEEEGDRVSAEQGSTETTKVSAREPAATPVSAAPRGLPAAGKPAGNELKPAGPVETQPTTNAATTADVATSVEVTGIANKKDTPAGALTNASSCRRNAGENEGEGGRVGTVEPKTKLRVVHVLEKKRVGGKGGEVARGSEKENFGRPSRAEEENFGRPPPEAGKIWTTRSSNPAVRDISEGRQDFGGGGVGEDSGGGRGTRVGGEGVGGRREKGGDDVGDSVIRSSKAQETRRPGETPRPEDPVSAQPQDEAPQPPSRQPPPRPKPPQLSPPPAASDSVSNAISNIEYAASILHQFPPSPLPRYVTAASSCSSTSTTTATNRQPPPPPKRHSVSTVVKPPSGSHISNTSPPEPPRRQTIPYNVNATIAASSSSSSSSSSISSGGGHLPTPQWDPSFVLANIGAMDQNNISGRKSSLKKNFQVDDDVNHLTNHNAGKPPIRSGQDGFKNGVAAPKTVRIQTPFLNDDVIHQGLLISAQDDNSNHRQPSIDNHSHHNGNIYSNRSLVGNTNDNVMSENGNLYTNNFNTTNKGTRPKTNSKFLEQHPRKIRLSKKTDENGSSQKTNVPGQRVTIVMRKGESHANHDILFQCHNTTGPSVIVSRFPVSASPVPTPSPSPAPSFMSTSSSSSCSSASSRVRSPAIPTAL